MKRKFRNVHLPTDRLSCTSVAGQLQVFELSVWHHRCGCEVWGQLSNVGFACSHLQIQTRSQRDQNKISLRFKCYIKVSIVHCKHLVLIYTKMGSKHISWNISDHTINLLSDTKTFQLHLQRIHLDLITRLPLLHFVVLFQFQLQLHSKQNNLLISRIIYGQPFWQWTNCYKSKLTQKHSCI